ncbi:MAG TPA: sporulation protein [Candidatus Limnocylindrales bacterium]
MGPTVHTARRRHPQMRLDLDDTRIRPGGRVSGELLLRGGDQPVLIEKLLAQLKARVYSDFDDDTGARGVELLRSTVGEGIELAADQPVTIPLRLPVAWHAPVTLSGRTELRGVSMLFSLWAEAQAPTGDTTAFLQVEPLPWQQRLFDACSRVGLRLETNYAGDKLWQSFALAVDDPQMPAAQRRPRSLEWKVQRRRLTVALYGRDRLAGSVELTHEQAEKQDWERLLRAWLTG